MVPLKSLALARILGFSHACGTVIKDDSLRANVLFVNETNDIDNILSDIYTVTNVMCDVHPDGYISIPRKLSDGIAGFERIVQGESQPKSFIREILGGFFGGVGHAPCLIGDNFRTVYLSLPTCHLKLSKQTSIAVQTPRIVGSIT